MASPGPWRTILTGLVALSLFLVSWDGGAIGGLPRAMLMRYLTVFCAAPLLLAELLRMRRLNLPVLLVISFLVLAWIRGTDTALPLQGLFSLRHYSVGLLAFVAIVSLDLGKRQVSIMIWAFILGAILSTFRMYISAGPEVDLRASVDKINTNFTSYCCVHAASLAGLWYHRHFRNRVHWRALLPTLGAVAICCYGVVISATRGAFLGLIPLLLLLGFGMPIKRPWVKVLLLCAVPVLIFLVIKSSPVLLHRLQGGDFNTDYGSERIPLWSTAWRLFSNAPVFGIGPGQFAHPFSEQGMPVHNVFLSVLTEFGVVGWLLYMGFVMTCFLRSSKIHGIAGAGLFFIPWSIIAFTGAWENAYAAYAGFGLVLALAETGSGFRGASGTT